MIEQREHWPNTPESFDAVLWDVLDRDTGQCLGRIRTTDPARYVAAESSDLGQRVTLQSRQTGEIVY